MKHRKVWLGTAIVLTLTAVGVAFARPFNLHNILFRARASVSMGTIEFDKANSTRSGTTNTTTASTQTGGGIICKTFNNDISKSSGKVGAVTNGSSIQFFESDGTTEYLFEDLEKISFAHDGKALGFDLVGIYDNGEAFSFSYSAKAASPREINFHNYGNVAHIRVNVTCSDVVSLEKITITYNCTTKYQTGVSIATAPTKTSYIEGESFDSTGMVVQALYSNNTSVVTESYTVYPTSLTTSDTYVTISYRGFSTTQAITVLENTIAGYYSYTSGSSTYALTINNDGTGVYHFTNTSYSYDCTMHFTWALNGSTLTFTKDEQPGDSQISSGISYDLFTISGSYNTTNTATINGDTIKLYTCSNSSRNGTAKNLAKQ